MNKLTVFVPHNNGLYLGFRFIITGNFTPCEQKTHWYRSARYLSLSTVTNSCRNQVLWALTRYRNCITHTVQVSKPRLDRNPYLVPNQSCIKWHLWRTWIGVVLYRYPSYRGYKYWLTCTIPSCYRESNLTSYRPRSRKQNSWKIRRGGASGPCRSMQRSSRPWSWRCPPPCGRCQGTGSIWNRVERWRRVLI